MKMKINGHDPADEESPNLGGDFFLPRPAFSDLQLTLQLHFPRIRL